MDISGWELVKVGLPGVFALSAATAKAAAWAVKKELNGSAQRIKDIDKKVELIDKRTERVEENQHVAAHRLSVLETVVSERTGHHNHVHRHE